MLGPHGIVAGMWKWRKRLLLSFLRVKALVSQLAYGYGTRRNGLLVKGSEYLHHTLFPATMSSGG